MNGAKRCMFQEACSAGHRASSKARDEVFLHHSLVVDSIEQGCRHCSGKFEQLLLTCIKGCGLRSNTNRFKVHAASAGMCTLLTIDIRTAREMRFSVSYNTVNNSCILAIIPLIVTSNILVDHKNILFLYHKFGC